MKNILKNDGVKFILMFIILILPASISFLMLKNFVKVEAPELKEMPTQVIATIDGKKEVLREYNTYILVQGEYESDYFYEYNLKKAEKITKKEYVYYDNITKEFWTKGAVMYGMFALTMITTCILMALFLMAELFFLPYIKSKNKKD